jgi:hypothetical protein
MEEMEGWMDADAHVAAVRSAADGRFNMLRAWGGGIWCDSLLSIHIYNSFNTPVQTMGVVFDNDISLGIGRLE